MAEATKSGKKRSYKSKIKFVSVIAKPLAPKELTKKCYKLIRMASKHQYCLRSGLREVQTKIRQGETGIVIFGGDIENIDIMCHMPAICEEKNIPYCYVPSRQDIGVATGYGRGSMMVLIREHEIYKELYDECKSEFKELFDKFILTTM